MTTQTITSRITRTPPEWRHRGHPKGKMSPTKLKRNKELNEVISKLHVGEWAPFPRHSLQGTASLKVKNLNASTDRMYAYRTAVDGSLWIGRLSKAKR